MLPVARLVSLQHPTTKEAHLSAVPWQYAICNELFTDWPLDRIAAYAGGLGYGGLELAPYTLAARVSDLSADDRRAIRGAIEDAGLRVAGLHWLLAHTEGLALNDADAEVRERTVRYLLEEIDLCADLGGDALVLGSPEQRNPAPGVSHDDAWAWTAEAMRRCGERAAARGVFFCIEALPGPACRFITNVDEAAHLVRQVDHPGFQMMVDVRSMATDGRPIDGQIASVAPLVRHVHANDPNMLGPGMGDVAFGPILTALRRVGYRGWISVEAFDTAYPIERIAQESIVNLRAAEEHKGAQ